MMTEMVCFREKCLGISRQRIGLKINNLAVCKQNNGIWHVYSLISLSRFFQPGLQGKQFAINLAKFFVDVYGEYLLIPKAWPEADVIQLARYSVKYGMKLYALHELDTVLDENSFKELFRTIL